MRAGFVEEQKRGSSELSRATAPLMRQESQDVPFRFPTSRGLSVGLLRRREASAQHSCYAAVRLRAVRLERVGICFCASTRLPDTNL